MPAGVVEPYPGGAARAAPPRPRQRARSPAHTLPRGPSTAHPAALQIGLPTDTLGPPEVCHTSKQKSKQKLCYLTMLVPSMTRARCRACYFSRLTRAAACRRPPTAPSLRSSATNRRVMCIYCPEGALVRNARAGVDPVATVRPDAAAPGDLPLFRSCQQREVLCEQPRTAARVVADVREVQRLCARRDRGIAPGHSRDPGSGGSPGCAGPVQVLRPLSQPSCEAALIDVDGRAVIWLAMSHPRNGAYWAEKRAGTALWPRIVTTHLPAP